jgi:hypothetical protein
LDCIGSGRDKSLLGEMVIALDRPRVHHRR